MSRFVDCFWDTEFNSTNGYDVLLKRMKDGREMCKDYEEFLKQRAKAEESFGKTLLKISKSSGGKELEIGSLKTGWNEVLTQTEYCGQTHIDISFRLLEEAKKVEEFRETQKERRRKSEESIKKLITTKKEQSNKVVHSKRNYDSKCREFDTAEELSNRGRMVYPQKEVDKLVAKKDKAKLAATTADQQYQKDVTTLEQTRQLWEEQMTQVCVIFQQLETERICYLRNAMWVFANVISLQCCNDDKNSDSMRKTLSDCDENKDIQLFISQKETGSSRPAPVVYECYYKDAAVAKSGGGLINGRHRQTLPRIPGDSPRVDQSRALPSPPQSSSKNDGIYSAMSEYSTGVVGENSNTTSLFMAKYDYEAQGNEELNLKTGDILSIINRDDETWWYAESNGKKGHVPAEYLGPYTNTGEESHLTYL